MHIPENFEGMVCFESILEIYESNSGKSHIRQTNKTISGHSYMYNIILVFNFMSSSILEALCMNVH